MATATNTPSRHAQLSALLAFAAANGYTGDVDKLEKVQTQWASSGGDTAIREENARYAQSVKDWMEPGKTYTNEQIREGVAGLPVGSKGKVEPSKVNAIMNAGKADGVFNVEVIGRMRFYSLA